MISRNRINCTKINHNYVTIRIHTQVLHIHVMHTCTNVKQINNQTTAIINFSTYYSRSAITFNYIYTDVYVCMYMYIAVQF